MKLKFDPEVCMRCETFDCLTMCLYLNYDLNSAREEMLKIARGDFSKVLRECYTCYGCEEYCPYNNHPFYRIVELQEKYEVRNVDEKMVRELIERYDIGGEFIPKKVGGKFVHICLFPEAKEIVKSKFFEGYDVIRGRHIFCNMIYLHYGLISVVKNRAERTIKNIEKLHAEKIILYHDECYAFYESFAKAYGINVPFNYVHYFEHLYDKLREFEIKELGLKVAYQRNCSNRLVPQIDKILDKIFELIGVERVEREFDRDRAICCGAVFELVGKNELAAELQKKNISDMVRSRATHAVFNCPMCYATLAKKVEAEGLKPLTVIDLCKMAIGEK